MNDLRTAAQQALESLEWHLERGAYGADIEGVTGNLRAALAQQAEPVQKQDVELSAALGWPGGISDPVLCRKVLLQKVAALAQQTEPVQTTHSAECWRWHHACAVAKLERLKERAK